MKKSKEQDNQSKTSRIFSIMILLLVPVFLILTLLSIHFARQRETEQEASRWNTLVNIAASEYLKDLNAEKQFDGKLENLLQLMTGSLKSFVSEQGYNGPRLFEHGFVAELEGDQVLLPDGIPDGELQISRELIEDGIRSGRMRTGRLITGQNGTYLLSFREISDSCIYAEMTKESDYAEYLDLYAAQSDSALRDAVSVIGGIARLYRQQDGSTKLLKQYMPDDVTEAPELSEEALRRRETAVTHNGVTYSCSYYDFPAEKSDDETITMVHMFPQSSPVWPGILQSALICFAMLLIFITAIVYLTSTKNYVKENILNEEQAEQFRPQKVRRRFINSGLVGALAILVVAMILQAIGHITLEIHYGRDALNVFAEQLGKYELNTEQEIRKKEAEWTVRYADEISSLLTECPELTSADRLQEFCDILKTDYIMLFDSYGKETLCSSGKGYVGFTLEDLGDGTNDFRTLLHGVPGLVQEPSSNRITGLVRQLIGVKMPAAKHDGKYGALIMALLPEPAEAASRSADANRQMELIGTNGVNCFAADSTTGEVLLSGDPSMIGKPITVLGLPEESLESGYLDFSRLEGTMYYIITKAYDSLIFYYAVKSAVMFQHDFLCSLLSALLFALEFAILLGYLLKDYDEKRFQEWAVVSVPDDDSDHGVLEKNIAKRKELKAAVKTRQGKDRLDAYWQKLLELLRWNEKLPGEKASFLFHTGFFLLVLFWLCLLFQNNNVFGEYKSLAGFLLRGDWRRGLTLFCLGGILLVTTYAYIFYNVCVWLLLLIASIVPGKGETVCRLLNSVIKYVSFFAILYFSLSYLGFPVSTIVASLGIVSLALSLGAQNLVADIIAGLFIVFEGSYHVGDYITINDGPRGRVREIGIRSTKLITSGNNLMIVSNHSIDNIVNLSKKVSVYRLEVNVSSEVSVQRVEALLQRELPLLKDKNDLILDGPRYAGIVSMGRVQPVQLSTVTYRIDTDCLEKDKGSVTFFVNREVALLFEREGITLY